MTSCFRCGAAVADGAAFCSSCGYNLTQHAIATATATPPETAAGAAFVPGMTPTGLGFGGTIGAVPADTTAGAAAAGSVADVLPRLAAALAPRYRVERPVGRGGMATVYLARDTTHDRDVAIKVLHPELAATIGGDRFQREIRVAAQLEHPHILGMLDSGTTADGLLYYVMPFVTGMSLRDKLASEGQLPIDETLRIFREVAGALGFAHAQGFIHRDIKPENILLEDGRALVADFGIARALSEADTQKLTQTGMAVGTPVYMAPEQAVGEKVGPAADIYSLGCVLFEMLAGEPPFYGTNAVAIMARHALEPPRSVRVVRPSVPETVDECIQAALEKSPADRPKTCEALVAILDAPAGSTTAYRTSLSQRGFSGGMRQAPPPPPSRLPAIVAGAGVVLALAVGGIGYTRGWFGAAPAELPANARRVAVLYFDDKSPSQALAPLADGLTEGLIDALGTVPSLTVISRGGVEKFKGSTLAVDSIARALNAGYVVRGSVEPENADVRVTLRLDDASGVEIGRKSLVRPSGALIALRDTLSAVAAELLRGQLGKDLQLKELRASTTDNDAWLLVQRGEQQRKRGEELLASGDSTGFKRAFAAADSLYLAAAARDGRWGTPLVSHAALAYRRARLAGRDQDAMRAWIDTGLVRVADAMRVAPTSSDALELRGNLRYWGVLNNYFADAAKQAAWVDSARADLEAAARNPRQAGAWSSLSHLYGRFGSSAEVQIAATKALEADEFLANADVVMGRLYTSAFDLGLFDKAKQYCTAIGQRFPATVLAVRCRLWQLTTGAERADVATAWTLADSVVALTPASRRPSVRPYVDNIVAAVIGRASKATPTLADSVRRVVQRATADPSVDPTREAALNGAFACTLIDDDDCAIRLLREYLAQNPDRIKSMREDPGWFFRSLATDARFRQLVGSTQ